MPITHRIHDMYKEHQEKKHESMQINAAVHTAITMFKTLPLPDKKAVLDDLQCAIVEKQTHELHTDDIVHGNITALLQNLSEDKIKTVHTILEKNYENEEHLSHLSEEGGADDSERIPSAENIQLPHAKIQIPEIPLKI